MSGFLIIFALSMLFQFSSYIISHINSLVNKEENINLELSSRNLSNVKVVNPEGLNVYDLLNSNSILIHKDSIDTILARTK